jgi:hypothetical protein
MDSEIIKKSNPSYMTDQEHHVKLFGLEDFWGNIFEYIDGLVTNKERNILTTTGLYNDSGSGYDNNGNIVTSSVMGGWHSKPHGTTELGFISKEVNGSQTTYFSDNVYISPNCVAYFGGVSEAGAGAFTLNIYTSASAQNNIGSRLMYL